MVALKPKEEENRKEHSSRANGAEVSLREEAKLGVQMSLAFRIEEDQGPAEMWVWSWLG